MIADSLDLLAKQRKNLFSQYVCDMKKVDESIAKNIIHRHKEDQFIDSWGKIVSNPSNRLTLSKPDHVTFFDNCKAFVNSINEIRLVQKKESIKKTTRIQLENIHKIDEEIRKLKIQQRQGDEY
jgi:uncharacterized protein YccT (UPF0319 family)